MKRLKLKAKTTENSTEESHEEKGHVKTIGIVVASLIGVLIIFLIIMKLNLMVSEQLRIVLTPEYSEFSATSPGNVSVSADISLYNKLFCSSICTYALRDLSHDVLLDTASFNSRTYISKQYSFSVQLKDSGYGRNIYTYDITCVNVPRALCPSENDSVVRRSIFIVNYNPAPDQLSALDYSKQNYVIIQQNLLNASKILSMGENIIFSNNSADAKIFFNATKYYSLKYQLDSLVFNIPGLIDLWKNDKYSDVQNMIIGKDLLTQSQKSRDDASNYYSYLITTINNHNSLLIELSNINPVLESYRNILNRGIYYSKNSTPLLARQSIVQGNNIVNSLNSPIHDYDAMYNDLAVLKKSVEDNNPSLINDTINTMSTNQPLLYIYTRLLCFTNRTTSNIPAFIALSCNNYLWQDFQLFNGSIVDASNLLDKTCGQSVAVTENLINSHSFNGTLSLENDSSEALLFMYVSLKDYELQYGSSAVSQSYSDYIKNILIDEYNLSDPDASIAGKSFNSSLIKLNTANALFTDILDFKQSCYSNSSNMINIILSTAKPYDLSLALSIGISSADNITLPGVPETVSKCCVYNICQSCENKSSKNPLILLHGHSFSQKTGAYMSIEIFNDFEQALINNKMYYPTGMLVNDYNSTVGVLGHYDIPIVSKATYYLDTYNDLLGLKVSESKTGNIDTYALRLKELIDYTKYVTGNNKVDIVAHSMGGLVVRRYMQVFGTNDLGTIVLIATPNNGISEKTYSLCKIFGASNECEDMRAGGLFINKLNDYTLQPDISHLYLVIGKGCNMDGLDGDGVVSVNNSLLRAVPQNHILYVNGTCSGTTMLHNELLKTNKYPEVYNFVKEKLN